MSTAYGMKKLGCEGGTPAVTHPLPSMFPGGMKVGSEEEEAVLEVLRSQRLFRYYGPRPGPSKVAELEQAFAEHMGAAHSLAVTSGTAALICGLASLAVGPGDEVIVPAYTWIAAASATVAVGAVPILAEVDESLTLDPADVERKITPHTKAIIAVHMRGAPSHLDELLAIARRHNLKLLEDAAQSDGATYHGRRVGTLGDVGAFSLQFNKIITSGEGGMVVTNDRQLYLRALMYHDTAASVRARLPDEEALPGVNLRMSELQAAVALAQLRRLDGLLAAMRQRKAVLKESLADVARRKGVQFRRLTDPEGDTGIALIFYLAGAAVAGRVADALRAEGVPANVLYRPGRPDYHVYCYWTPIMAKRTWSPNGGPWRWHEGEVEYRQDMCPRTLDLLGRAVHLDVSPELSDENLAEVGEALNKVLAALA